MTTIKGIGNKIEIINRPNDEEDLLKIKDIIKHFISDFKNIKNIEKPEEHEFIIEFIKKENQIAVFPNCVHYYDLLEILKYLNKMMLN